MIIVTGAPRTGTSLMMSMLKEAGFNVIGEKFPEAWESKGDKLKEFNKHGFYESKFISQGIYNENCPLDAIQNEYSAVKVFGGYVKKTDQHYIDKMIVMVRDCDEQAESVRRLYANNLNVPFGDPRGMKYKDGYEYFHHYFEIVNDIAKRKYQVLPVDYNVLIEKPTEVCNAIRNYLGMGRWDLAEKLIQKEDKTVDQKEVKIWIEDDVFRGFLKRLSSAILTGLVTEQMRDEMRNWKDKIYKEVEEVNNKKETEE